MSVNLTAINQYKTVNVRSAVASASPHQLISMLYDGALTALANAKGCIVRKDIEGRAKSLNKANAIMLALQDYLDVEKGGEIAENLSALYRYIVTGIIIANREQNAKKIQELINLLLELKQGWASMPLNIRKGQSFR
ncbi:MAG: flagellar export chaperone FliS [Moritella sp.]|uniref:flagellar export chaperone FliS n=1 Tax=Moritella sp. TaxID=78556 RepID=UPI001D83CDBB|nr:flagellar export chaperone FliS [Moritella sp.]NQZ51872.1 flagellar export chaperone FliS [Moritella sp.]